MRTGPLFVGILIFLTTVCAAQTVLSDFEREHDLARKQNPPGLQATLVIEGGRQVFRLSDPMKLKLLLKAQGTDVYFLAYTGFNDELVLQPPYPLHSMRIRFQHGCIGGCSWRIPITPTGFGESNVTILSKDARQSFLADVLQPGGGHGSAPLPPGEYAMYLQTKSVLERSTGKTGDGKSEHVVPVTSDNVVHITVLPGVNAQPGSPAPRGR